MNLYQLWSSYTPEEKGTLVAYGSLHGNTAKAALLLADALRQAGAQDGSTVRMDDMEFDFVE